MVFMRRVVWFMSHKTRRHTDVMILKLPVAELYPALNVYPLSLYGILQILAMQ